MSRIDYLVKDAVFSPCGKYRYVLSREWGFIERPIALCVGLNPSTANAEKDDPTINRLAQTLSHLGYGGFRMMNLYALISSTPARLFEVPDAIKDNDQWLLKMREECDTVIFCWGNFKNTEFRAKQVAKLFPEARCFGKNKNGTPWHPLAMMYEGYKVTEAELIEF